MSHPDGSARAAAKRAADLLAVLDPRLEPPDPQVVVDVLRGYGEPEPIDLDAAGVTALRAAAAELWKVFAASSTGQAADRLNAILQAHAGPPRLSAHQDTAWHIHVDQDDDGPWAQWFASSSAMALATLLAERQVNPAGLCASSRCGRPFIDLGQGAPRRYCSPRCATRERVAAHRKLGGQPRRPIE